MVSFSCDISINLNDYVAIRNDRSSCGGCVMMYVKKNVDYNVLCTYNSKEVAYTFIEFDFDGTNVSLQQ